MKSRTEKAREHIMKNKWVKRLLLASAAGLLAGGICVGAGTAMGGSPMFYVNAQGIHVKEDQKPEDSADYRLEATETGTLQNIHIDMAEADIRLVSGERFAAEYVLNGQRLAPGYSVSGGTLTITESSSWKSGANFHFWGGMWESEEGSVSPYVQITVPKNAVLSDVELSNKYGDIRIDTKLNAKNLTVRAENGEVRMEDWNGGSFELEMTYGEFRGGSLSGKNVDIQSESGGVSLGGLKADAAEVEMEYGELEAMLEKPCRLNIQNGNGNILLLLNGSEKEYGLNLYTEYGVISTPRKTVEPYEDEGESGAEYIRTGSGKAEIYADAEYGDITVRELKK